MGIAPWEQATSPGGVRVDDGETLAHFCQDLGLPIGLPWFSFP
jgi:hypothetical protein